MIIRDTELERAKKLITEIRRMIKGNQLRIASQRLNDLNDILLNAKEEPCAKKETQEEQ